MTDAPRLSRADLVSMGADGEMFCNGTKAGLAWQAFGLAICESHPCRKGHVKGDAPTIVVGIEKTKTGMGYA